MSVYYNDIEAYPCKVLRARIKDGLLPPGLVDERDICDVTAQDIASYAHVHLFAGIGVFSLGFKRAGVPMGCRIVTGGFPCQDLSVAGKQAGLSGERSGLWFQMVRLIEESNGLGTPFDFIVIENVRNLLSGGDYEEDAIRATDSGTMGEVATDPIWQSWMGTVLADLAEVGYDAEWRVLSASDYGAPHRRERIFIVAYPGNLMVRTRANIAGYLGETPASENRQGISTLCNTSPYSSTGMAHTLDTRCADTRHVSDRQVPRWQEPGWEQSTNRTGRSSESELADAASRERAWSGNTWTGRDEPANVGTLEYPDSQRCEEQHSTAVASPSRRTCESDATGMADTTRTEDGRVQQSRVSPDFSAGSRDVGDPEYGRRKGRDTQGRRTSGTTLSSSGTESRIFAQPGICRIFDGSAYRLDGYQWPARPGKQQYTWEPPRVIAGKLPNRKPRLKALGNSLVLPIAEDIGYRIKAAWLARLERVS